MTVVFISYNSAPDLDSALAGLGKAADGIPTRVLVVENGRESTPTEAVCARFGAELVLPGRNLGYGAAANRAAAMVSSEYLAISNPDIVFEPGTLRRLIEFMDSHPDAGVVSPQLFYPDGSPQPSARRRPGFRYVVAGRRSVLARFGRPGRAAREFQYLGSESSSAPLNVDAVVGAFMLFRYQAFAAVGGFDPRYFMFAEDIDICLRLAPHWCAYLLPTARLVHAVGNTRRRARIFTEFHRLRSLHRLFRRSHARAVGPFIGLAFTGYLALLMAGDAVGVGEYEYSWRAR